MGCSVRDVREGKGGDEASEAIPVRQDENTVMLRRKEGEKNKEGGIQELPSFLRVDQLQKHVFTKEH